jgi:thiamine-phosphate pyrophosphorylase
VTVLHGVATRLALARLGFVTDSRGGGEAWEAYCRELFVAGVNLLLIDQPGANPDQLKAAVRGGLRANFGAGSLVGLVWPGVPEVSVDLIHLSTREPVTLEDGLVPLVGRPAQSVADIKRWTDDPSVAYFTVGPVLDSGETDLARGLGLIRAAAQLAPVADPDSKPWFATGGITADNLEAVLAAGARRILVHRAIAAAPEPAKVAREWQNRLRRLWREDPALKDYGFAKRRADRGDD